MKRSQLFVLLIAVCFMACFSVVPLHMGEPQGPAVVARGKEIVEGVAACGFCHGETPSPDSILSGGQELEDRYGSVTAPNLTSHESGLKDLSTGDIVRVLRHSMRTDGSKVSKDFHRYEWMSDEDMLSIVAYLRTLPPVKAEHDSRSLGFIDRNVAGFSESWRAYDNYVPVISKKDTQAYGRYVIDFVANCNGCHATPASLFGSGEFLGGGKLQSGPTGERYVPGITNAEVDGVGTWSVDAILLYLKTGRTPDGRMADGEYCPFPFYSRAPENDLLAIATYLKSLP